jgi:hypothetical protein
MILLKYWSQRIYIFYENYNYLRNISKVVLINISLISKIYSKSNLIKFISKLKIQYNLNEITIYMMNKSLIKNFRMIMI